MTAVTAPVFVLVHGVMHGGWCWRAVRQLLAARGVTVFTPTLTGMGERSHLLSKDVGVPTHVEDYEHAAEHQILAGVHCSELITYQGMRVIG